LGITGGIAAYKAAELARLFIRAGYPVQVVMTAAATKFITPLTFETITGNKVALDLFGGPIEGRVRHISLADGAEIMVVAPASANTLAKMAHGIADNLLTTLFLAVRCPVVLVPSMNEAMYAHPAVQKNIQMLRDMGCHIMEPEAGELACGVVGKGRLPDPSDIFCFVRAVLSPKDFRGVRALVTAGPTREHFDPVRFISNPSSGRMGYAMARALSERGAAVTLVSGPCSLNCPAGVERIEVCTAEEMYHAVLARFAECHLVIKAAAVSDFRPATVAPQKVKKDAGAETVRLENTPDILKELGRRKQNQVLVGFAAETEQAEAHGREKLEKKNLDLIVVNDLTAAGAGFASLTNRVSLINRSGAVEHLPLMEKETLAHHILDRIVALLPR